MSGTKRRRESKGEWKGETPRRFKGPSPLIRNAQDLRRSVRRWIDEPFRWRPTRVANGQYRMTVSAMVGNVHQSSQVYEEGCGNSCALLACMVAEWILLHPGFSAPSSHNLDALFPAVMQIQEDFKTKSEYRELDEVLKTEFKGRLHISREFCGHVGSPSRENLGSTNWDVGDHLLAGPIGKVFDKSNASFGSSTLSGPSFTSSSIVLMCLPSTRVPSFTTPPTPVVDTVRRRVPPLVSVTSFTCFHIRNMKQLCFMR
ncbi:hypothetical protein GOP47_0012528 [Adiantum capillus-veneris]|uniref:Uncharacterized protein n=1 Tax=Adiantum capillus-veneris TaxID=13818 RepID=A0A9D4URC9_ADICA|nr:hypothetical protein GOP47_0012528 [Adiantum capillus-veneris]